MLARTTTGKTRIDFAFLMDDGTPFEVEFRIRRPDGTTRWIWDRGFPLTGASGERHVAGIAQDITSKKAAEVEREKLIGALQQALAEVKTLSGLLPICAQCKKIRDDGGYWNMLESYIEKHSGALFTHSLYPECIEHLYPELRDRESPGPVHEG